MHKDFYANNDELKLKLLISYENYLHWFVEYLYGFKIPYYANEWAPEESNCEKKNEINYKDIITHSELTPTFHLSPWEDLCQEWWSFL